MSEVKGYKIFNPDWTCRDFQFEVGKIFEEDVEPKCCNSGFHFCLNAADCFEYYGFDSKNKVAEVIALGEVDYQEEDSKCCTNKIQIVREIPWEEVLRIVNTGKDCTGRRNTGDRNTGDRNTGCFNTKEQKILLFNSPSEWTYEEWRNSDAKWLLNNIPKNVVEWIYEEDMTDKEKTDNPTYKTTGGYLKVLDESESAQIWWNGLPEEKRQIIKNIPNFDTEIFKECTGIDVEQEEK